MSDITLSNSSLNRRQPTYFEKVSAWMDEHPTTTKILKIAVLIAGIGLLVSLPFTAATLDIAFTVTLGIVGAFLTLASLYSLFGSSVNPNRQPPETPDTQKTDVPLENRNSVPPSNGDIQNIEIPNPAGADGFSQMQLDFGSVDSSKLTTLPGPSISGRKEFWGLNFKCPPPFISKSGFVSEEMVEHLMRNKKDRAIGVKYEPRDLITNMEGALHTFVTPVAPIFITGDYKWMGANGGLKGRGFGNNQVREVILSAAIHPDFEKPTVMMQLVKVGKQEVKGESLASNDIPKLSTKNDEDFRNEYERQLIKHMIYHLLPTHRLPALSEIASDQIMGKDDTESYLESLIGDPKENGLQGKFMKVNDNVISLELLFQIYVEQIRNEFKVLNPNTPQGYVYTINPPSIFAATIGGAKILNRLQALAFQSLLSSEKGLFSNLKVFGYDGYADEKMVPLFTKIWSQEIKVLDQKDLFRADYSYQGPEGLALVVHNNSDGFGQNIETERASSLDGVIGTYSNAACVLKRDRLDLVDHIL